MREGVAYTEEGVVTRGRWKLYEEELGAKAAGTWEEAHRGGSCMCRDAGHHMHGEVGDRS
jgi:hypothetical protein